MTNHPATPWISATVLRGDQVGRTIDFPSLNLDSTLMPSTLQKKPGVYSSRVRIGATEYTGALYYGPRLVKGETHNVLEIHVLDFNQEIYGETIAFIVDEFVRPPLDFASLEGLKQQLGEDVARVRH